MSCKAQGVSNVLPAAIEEVICIPDVVLHVAQVTGLNVASMLMLIS